MLRHVRRQQSPAEPIEWRNERDEEHDFPEEIREHLSASYTAPLASATPETKGTTPIGPVGNEERNEDERIEAPGEPERVWLDRHGAMRRGRARQQQKS